MAAGAPTPGQAPKGRRAEMSDLMQSVNPSGKIVFKVSDAFMADASIQLGDTILVDPKAEIRDGDLALATIAGGARVIGRLRVAAGGEATLESGVTDWPPIKLANAADPRLLGKIVWRCGPLR